MKIIYTYYSSDILENMLFATEEDAKNFDNALQNFVNSEEALTEFKRVSNHYASPASVRHAITRGEFHFGLTGKIGNILLRACEQMVRGRNYLKDDEYYKEAMNYILNYIIEHDKERMDN